MLLSREGPLRHVSAKLLLLLPVQIQDGRIRRTQWRRKYPRSLNLEGLLLIRRVSLLLDGPYYFPGFTCHQVDLCLQLLTLPRAPIHFAQEK